VQLLFGKQRITIRMFVAHGDFQQRLSARK